MPHFIVAHAVNKIYVYLGSLKNPSADKIALKILGPERQNRAGKQAV